MWIANGIDNSERHITPNVSQAQQIRAGSRRTLRANTRILFCSPATNLTASTLGFAVHTGEC